MYYNRISFVKITFYIDLLAMERLNIKGGEAFQAL